MDEFSKPQKFSINVGPPDNPFAKIIRTERRLGLEDRRRLNTYIANDRRGGLPNRRKPIVPRLRRVRTEDRHQSLLFLPRIGDVALLTDEILKGLCQLGGEGKRVIDADTDGCVAANNLFIMDPFFLFV